jgi:hypothetical protein
VSLSPSTAKTCSCDQTISAPLGGRFPSQGISLLTCFPWSDTQTAIRCSPVGGARATGARRGREVALARSSSRGQALRYKFVAL